MSDPEPYCKHGHYEEHDRLPECINELLINEHENHETLRSDCSYCAAVLDIEMQAYRPRQAPMTRDEIEAMEADRELMRDEFHVR